MTLAKDVPFEFSGKLENNCQKLVIEDNTDYAGINGTFDRSNVNSVIVTAFTPPDYTNSTDVDITAEYKNHVNGGITTYNISSSQFGFDQFKDGVWKFKITIEDSTTGEDLFYDPAYCEFMKCIRKRSAQLPALYKACNNCYDKNLVESFNLYMVYLQSALFKVQTEDYDSANELLLAGNSMCNFHCNCN